MRTRHRRVIPVKIARYAYRGREGAGVILDGTICPARTNIFSPVPDGDPIPLSAVALLPPIARCAKIVCVGRNYPDRAVEDGAAVPD